MATNKHAIIRYQTLDKCFRNPGRKYFIEDLVEACSIAIYEFSGNNNGIKRRQVLEDIKFMESIWAVFKVLFDKGYIYRGCRIMPYSNACGTVLSNFEVQ